jgi:small subunit ribosomal protein S1
MKTSNQEYAQEESFAELWQTVQGQYDYVTPQRGDIREGVILSVRPSEVMVDIGVKQDALVAGRELDQMPPEEFAQLHVGNRVWVYILRYDPQSGVVLVSLRMAREQEDWIEAERLMESGEIEPVTVTQYNKGGLLCTFRGLQGFIPASQVMELGRAQSRAHADALEGFIGAEMRVKVIEVNRRRRRLILSERAAAREWRAQQRERLLADIEQGQIREGIVSNLVDFGAFIDLGGLDGLIHLSELSWGRIDHPKDVVRVGQTVKVLVLNVDRERQRIGLSLKRTQADPWISVKERYQEGQMVSGTVTHLVKFGAFVELEPGIEGLVHLSEFGPGDPAALSDMVREGTQLSLLVLSVDPDQHRISLSLRQTPEEGSQTHDQQTGAPDDEQHATAAEG